MQQLNGVERVGVAAGSAIPAMENCNEPIMLPPEVIAKLREPLPPEAVSPNPQKVAERQFRSNWPSPDSSIAFIAGECGFEKDDCERSCGCVAQESRGSLTFNGDPGNFLRGALILSIEAASTM